MNDEIKISVENLSKFFIRHQRNKVKGISTDGFEALWYVLKKMLHQSTQPILLNKNDENIFFALDKISFDVKAGEVLGIIGRNGAGKSTLLKILARVMDPSAGRVAICGRVMSMLELGIGLAPDLTVRENIQIQGRLAGIAPKYIRSVEDSILEFAGLTEFRDILLSKCPSGSFAQLGFAAMINFNVDIILADEVLAVGDARFRQACEERVLAAGKSGESVLFVSHDMNAIQRVCSRVIWIDKGKIVRMGRTAEVIQAYTVELLAGHLLPPLSEAELAMSCRLLDFRLLDSNRSPVGALQITESGYIDCLLRVSRSDIAVTVQIELRQEGHCVLFTETERAIIEKEAVTFRLGVKIPGNLLNELSYQARCRVCITRLNEPHLPVLILTEEQLNFTVMNSRPNESVWVDWAWARPGLISPKLPWTVEFEK